MTEIGFGIELYEMHHAVVEAIPEVAGSTALGAGHAEVVDVAGEIGLTGHADADIVSDVLDMVSGTTVVAVCFVVAWDLVSVEELLSFL